MSCLSITDYSLTGVVLLGRGTPDLGVKGSSTTLTTVFYLSNGRIHRSTVFCNSMQYPAKIIYSNFQPLDAVSRYRDPQPQVVEITHISFI